VHLGGVGGAFGGREDLSMQIHGALLALHTNRPVKIVYNREESFTGHVHRHPARIWVEHRATREGRLVAVRMRILLDGGAYASSSTAVCSNAASFSLGPYEVPNAFIESTAVYTNNPPCGAMRGFGAVQTCFAGEAQMDKLADALDVDPVELRLLNALAPGDRLPTGQAIR
jgi:CO/xanthine dehydrogenase Mo-binding subunit